MAAALELSAPQILERASLCTAAELEATLHLALANFPSTCNNLLSLLIRKHRMTLADSWARLKGVGFRMGPAQLEFLVDKLSEKTVFNLWFWRTLRRREFDLVWGLWDKMHIGNVKDWFGLCFLKYWQSDPEGYMSGDLALRFKPMWSRVQPTVSEKITPLRVLDLSWPAFETVSLVDKFVDTDGDSGPLVLELLSRGIMTSELANRHQGFLGALLDIDSCWVVQRVLAGELVLSNFRPSQALAVLKVLAATSGDLTAQNVKHLMKLLDSLKAVKKAGNMMYQGLGYVMKLVSKLAVEDRGLVLIFVSGYYLDDAGRSGLAEVPNPKRGQPGYLGDSTKSVQVYEAFVDKAIDFIDLSECTLTVRPATEITVSVALRTKLCAWTLKQLKVPQISNVVLSFLEKWVLKLCTPPQVLEIWLAMVECMNSFSFLMNSLDFLPKVVQDSTEEERRLAESVYAHVAKQLDLGTCVSAIRRQCILVELAKHWPQRFAEQFGIRSWIEHSKMASQKFPLVSRKSCTLSVGAAQINDALNPHKECLAVLKQNPKVEQTKTKEDWQMVLDWVNNLDPSVFTDAGIVDRMSKVMCAVWGDRNALQFACGVYSSKLLLCLPVTRECSALVLFLLSCPNLGNKRDFLLQQFRMYASSSGKADLDVLHVLLASQLTKVNDLVDCIHELKAKQVCGKTEDLFYELLGKEGPLEKVKTLACCNFVTSKTAALLDECVEAEGQVWNQLERDALAAEPHGDPESVVTDEVKMGSGASLFKVLGGRGEAVFAEFFAVAEPAQLRLLFETDSTLRDRCRDFLGHSWRLAACPRDQVDDLVTLIVDMFPDLWARFAPLVWKAGTVGNEASEEQVRKVMRGRVPDLDVLPRSWWSCIDFSKVKEDDMGMLLAAGVVVKLAAVDFAQLKWETQQLLLDAHVNDLEVLAKFAPMALGPIVRYIDRVFELLSTSNALLVSLGEGLAETERLASGWNKVVSSLLCGIRERIKGGNFLNANEQLAIYRKIEGRADNSNSALLSDFMEGKYVDPNHSGALVNYVLSDKTFNKQVQDSALRAMNRLEPVERNALHKRLLDTKAKLPLQVLFSLSVTTLEQDVVPLVLAQLNLLDPKDWSKLIALIKEANPKEGKVHTFPRSLRANFNELFLAEYLSEKPSLWDARLFHLFVVCTDSQQLPKYLLDVLARQLHPLTDMFFKVLDLPLEKLQFQAFVDFLQPAEWSSRVDWMLCKVTEASEPHAFLRGMLELLDRPAFQPHRIELLSRIITWRHTVWGELLKKSDLRDLLLWAVQRYANRALWINFFKTSWTAGVPEEAGLMEAELSRALDLEKNPLNATEVDALGVSLNSRKLLVRLVPAIAIPKHGFEILKAEPGFGASLNDEQFAMITQLSALKDEQWPLIRTLIGLVKTDRALRWSMDLLKNSREDKDFELVKVSYRSADAFTRCQTRLRVEFNAIWPAFGARIQCEIIDGASAVSAAVSSVAPFDTLPPQQPQQ